MLENLRDKIQNVQHDLSVSLKGLAISPEAKDEMRTKLGLTVRDRKKSHQHVSLNAGADLLHRYQTQWHEMHQKNEENAKNAAIVAKSINDLETEAKKRHTAMNELISQLSSLPQINETIESIERDLKRIKQQFVKCEQLLTELQNEKEIEDFDKLKMDHHYQLAVYKEKRASDFETIKVKMALDHTSKVQEHEKSQQLILKERQQAFHEAFEEELNMYKTHGKIERTEIVKSDTRENTKIEEIVVDTDAAEEAALAKFLEDDNTDASLS